MHKALFFTKDVYPTWPMISILFLCLVYSTLPAAVISALNGYFLLLALMVFWQSRTSFPKDLWCLIVPFIVAIIAGLVSGAGNEKYAYFKDIWYFINPILIISVGYCFGRVMPDLPRAFLALVVAGTIMATFHLIKFAINPNLFLLSAVEVRLKAGGGNFAVCLACFLLTMNLWKWRESINIPKWFGVLAFVITSFSVVMSYSRTLFILFILMAIAYRGWMIGKKIAKVGIAVLIFIGLLISISSFVDTNTPEMKKSFVGKVLRATEEITISDYRNEASINDNYRGFESARGLKAYAEGNPLQWLIGRGFGYDTDLGLYINLGDGPMRFIPVFHNGYVYLLVKAGLIGFVTYMFFIWYIFLCGMRSASNSQSATIQLAGRLLQGFSAVLLVTTYLISGAFNKVNLFPVLLFTGFCLAVIDAHSHILVKKATEPNLKVENKRSLLR
jgi:O-antigen ligase